MALTQVAASMVAAAAPQVTVYTSGSGTYTTPTNAKYLQIKMVGGGGGGSGGYNGSIYTSGTSGGNTTFSTLTANGARQVLATLQLTGELRLEET